MSILIRKTWTVDGVLTDAISAELADPTGTFGIKRNDTSEVVVAADTEMTRVSAGAYEYTFSAAEGVAYTAYVKIVYAGATYCFERDIPASVAPASSSFDYSNIRQAVGFMLGFGRDPEVDWSPGDDAVVDDTIREGLMMAYQPPQTGEGYVHQWSFLKPTYEFETVAGQFDYAMPNDFEAWEGDLFFAASEVARHPPVQHTTPGRLLDLMQADDSPTYPRWFAMFPADSDGATAQGWKLRLYPTPNAVYAMVGRYTAGQSMLSAANPYPLGPKSFSYAVYLACQAAAEIKVLDEPGPWNAKFHDRIMAEISADLSRYGTKLGYMGDGMGANFYPSRSAARRYLLIPGGSLTYNGVDPHA